MSKGSFLLVLHAHLPFINHPDFPNFMEESWLFEGITETYIPLLEVFRKLDKDAVDFKVTMSITPPLMEMMTNQDLQRKYVRHLERLIDLSGKEVERTADESPRKHKMARYYKQHFENTLNIYKEVDGDLPRAFAEFQEKGNLDIITCNATHGFLPLMIRHPKAINAQVKIGVETYEQHTGRKPRGIWLAECGYVSGQDSHLKNNGLEFFFVDSHGLWYADPAPRYGVYRPVITPNDVFVFARDPESSQQVWSAEAGYPGDPRYREFYRDIGFDREDWYMRPYMDSSGERSNTGIKYHKITGKDVDLKDKEYYDIDEAMEAARGHARDFAAKKREQVKNLYSQFEGVEPVIVAPFDAELFGHWWYEGPFFIEELFRELSKVPEVVPSTPTEVIDSLEQVQVATPSDSTWGANGYNEVWLNGKNDWIYNHLDEITERMVSSAEQYRDISDPKKERVLNQMARELLLAQSSDWAFIMTTGTTVEYAVNRTKTHVKRFLDLEEQLKSGNIDEAYLETLEWIDGIFSNIDFRVYAE
ncbi:MAG TPA: DUF1957 domain-containing protein [Kosmotogaceae bacterium]|nr:MAG: Uncharacterized protein XE05_0485 [Thermotogales bacterium 46_20]HAA86496.1 DUF1957 domain-containing protein [Kosmotogaceae bacterium]